jgi:hypothetical protein
MPRRKPINTETQYHPAYWKRVKNELEAQNTKAASIAMRKNILDAQKRADYQREFENIRGILSHSSVPYEHNPYKGVYLIGTGPKQIEVKAPKPFPQYIYKELIKNTQTRQFKKGMNIFMTNKDFKETWQHKPGYIVAFKIVSYETIGDTDKEYNPLDADLMDASNVSCNFNYMETNVDLDKKTFMESIKNKKYRDSECWINSITDFYGETLMNTDRKRNVLTRAKLLTILNKTEGTVKLGISVNDVLPFFQQYKLNLRVFDVFGKMIFRHDPKTKNNHNKTMYRMIKGNHVYTLNHNLASLEQKLNSKPELCVKATSDHNIGQKKDTNFKMIAHVDDLIKLISDITSEGKPEEKVVLNLIYKGVKRTDLLYEIKAAGYDPSIKYEGGRLTQIGLTLETKIFVLI